MKRFKVGEKVILVKEVNSSIPIGIYGIVERDDSSDYRPYLVEFTNDKFKRELWCNPDDIKPVESVDNVKITIEFCGLATIGAYSMNGVEIASSLAKCNPSDTFNEEVGAELALKRLFEKIVFAEPEQAVFKVGDIVLFVKNSYNAKIKIGEKVVVIGKRSDGNFEVKPIEREVSYSYYQVVSPDSLATIIPDVPKVPEVSKSKEVMEVLEVGEYVIGIRADSDFGTNWEPNHEMVGEVGIIISYDKESKQCYNVDFGDFNWHCAPDQIKKFEKPVELPKFKIGDVVICNDGLFKDAIGTIITLDGSFGVKLTKKSPNGHTLDGHCESGFGRWFSKADLKLVDIVTVKEYVKQDTYKKGDLVKLIDHRDYNYNHSGFMDYLFDAEVIIETKANRDMDDYYISAPEDSFTDKWIIHNTAIVGKVVEKKYVKENRKAKIGELIQLTNAYWNHSMVGDIMLVSEDYGGGCVGVYEKDHPVHCGFDKKSMYDWTYDQKNYVVLTEVK